MRETKASHWICHIINSLQKVKQNLCDIFHWTLDHFRKSLYPFFIFFRVNVTSYKDQSCLRSVLEWKGWSNKLTISGSGGCQCQQWWVKGVKVRTLSRQNERQALIVFVFYVSLPNQIKLLLFNIQGDHLERRESRGPLCNLKMHFRGCLRALIDHKYGTFHNLHQGSWIYHFKFQ